MMITEARQDDYKDKKCPFDRNVQVYMDHKTEKPKAVRLTK